MSQIHQLDIIMDDIASACAASFGTERVSESLASGLRAKLPFATFLRVSIRCGSGLFITTDLLRPGSLLVTVVSLQSSMAGVAMKEGKPVSVHVAPSMSSKWLAGPDGSRTASVLCYPVGVQPAAEGGSGGSFIGALQVGLAVPLLERGHAELEALCQGLGPYLLLVSLTKVQEMAKMVVLPGTECSCCVAKEELECDAPYGRCLEDFGPGSGPPGGAAPTQATATCAVTSAAAVQQQQQEQEPRRTPPPSPAEEPTTPNAGALPRSAAAAVAVEAAAAGLAAMADAELAYHPRQQQQGQQQQEAGLEPIGLRYRRGTGSLSSRESSLVESSTSPFEAAGRKGDVSGGGGGKLGAAGLGTGAEAASALHMPWAGSEGDGEEGDPKAVAKLEHSVRRAAALRQGLLLTFRGPGMEARFRQEQAENLIRLDLLFHVVYLVALTCSAALDPAGVLGTSSNIYLAWVLALPPVAILTCTAWYLRWRTVLAVLLTLLHVSHYRLFAVPALLQSMPTAALRKLPWLMRCTGAETLLVFPLGNKMPLSVFLPVQLASVLLMLTLLPGPCQALSPLLPFLSGCLPGGWGLRCGAALLGAGFVLPTCVVYFAESRARSHFARMVQGVQA